MTPQEALARTIERIETFRDRLRAATVRHAHYAELVKEFDGKDTFFYLDPPYHKTYDGYNGNGFYDDEHKKLAEFCQEINNAHASFMLSNSDTPLVRSLYASYHIEVVEASRSVSCKGHQRGKEHELIIRNYQ